MMPGGYMMLIQAAVLEVRAFFNEQSGQRWEAGKTQERDEPDTQEAKPHPITGRSEGVTQVTITETGSR